MSPVESRYGQKMNHKRDCCIDQISVSIQRISTCKKPNRVIPFFFHGDSIVHLKIVEAQKRVRDENCQQDSIKPNITPKLPHQMPFRTLLKKAKNSRSGEALHDTCLNMLFKNMRQLWALL